MTTAVLAASSSAGVSDTAHAIGGVVWPGSTGAVAFSRRRVRRVSWTNPLLLPPLLPLLLLITLSPVATSAGDSAAAGGAGGCSSASSRGAAPTTTSSGRCSGWSRLSSYSTSRKLAARRANRLPPPSSMTMYRPFSASFDSTVPVRPLCCGAPFRPWTWTAAPTANCKAAAAPPGAPSDSSSSPAAAAVAMGHAQWRVELSVRSRLTRGEGQAGSIARRSRHRPRSALTNSTVAGIRPGRNIFHPAWWARWGQNAEKPTSRHSSRPSWPALSP